MTKKQSLGDLQLAIMRVLWRTGEAAVADVSPALLLSKFRFLSSIPAERLLSPPWLEEPVRDDSVLRLLSRF